MKTTLFKREISLGKIAYSNPKRKANEVSIEICLELRKQNKRTIDLEEISEYVTLSICGNIWNTRKTDCVSCGQNLEEIGKYFPVSYVGTNNERVQRIVQIWRRWHLNDLKAGTRKQMFEIDLHEKYGNISKVMNYEERCTFLKNKGLYTHKLSEILEEQKYASLSDGSSWLVEILPNAIIEELPKLANSFPTFTR